jgi:hypothetical protein
VGERELQRPRVEWEGIYLSRGPLDAIKDAPLGVCSSECGRCKHKGSGSGGECEGEITQSQGVYCSGSGLGNRKRW